MSMFRRIFALAAGLAASVSAFVHRPKISTQVQPDGVYTAPSRRIRQKGTPGRAGDKLARMAAERRLTIRKGW